jgi:hypothetical protein
MDPTRADEQLRELREHVVPTVREFRGFVSGYWTYNLTTGKLYGFVILESEEAAQALLESTERAIGRGTDSGVQLDAIGLAEVVAKA